ASDNARWSRARASLVAFESALTSALLVLGGLLLASFVRVSNVDRGFAVDRIVAFDLVLPETRYPTAAERAPFFDRLLESLQAIPGVDSAATATKLPLEGERAIDALIPLGDTRPVAEQQHANHLQVSPAYFQTLGIPVIRGRNMTETNRGRHVALVSEHTAR